MNIDLYLALRLRSLRGKTLVHVGAHGGEEARKYETLGAARVVWVEADPDMFRRLQANLDAAARRPQPLIARILGFPRTQHIAVEALVGDEDGREVEFRVVNNDGASSSIFGLHDNARARFAGLSETGEVRRLTMRRLDTVLAEAGVPPSEVDAMVIDVQGAELLCLRGAEAALRSAELLECEVSRIPIYEGGVLLDELSSWLKARGFTLAAPVRQDHTDAVFRRTARPA